MAQDTTLHPPETSEEYPSETPQNKLKLTLKYLASLKLTVTLMALSTLLIFIGTLAQVDQGIWSVVRRYFHTTIAWVELQIFFPRTLKVPGIFPFPGGYLLGGGLFLNLLAAYYNRLVMSWKRAGLYMIHLGILLLLLGELFTGLFAYEGNMSIDEGSSSNYTEDIRTVELAIIDPSDKEEDEVVVIPAHLLQKQQLIQHKHLPFDIQVKRFLKNSVLLKERNNPSAPWEAEERPEVSGTDTQNRIDMPSVDMIIYEKNSSKVVEKMMVSSWLEQAKPLRYNKKKYELSLRFYRKYRPYSLHLLDFKFDRYMGTDIPKNFSSNIRLVDPERNVDREVKIWMNHPLRYRGETYYQASFKPNEKGTVLQVVRNPSWLLPYIACALVSLGLTYHFLIALARSLRRKRKKA